MRKKKKNQSVIIDSFECIRLNILNSRTTNMITVAVAKLHV